MNSKNFALAAVALACATGAHAAAHESIGYVTEPSLGGAYLVDWDAAAHRAHLVEAVGMGDGTWTDDGTLRVLTLSAPIETTTQTFDCNGNDMTQTVDLLQLAVRHVAGGAHKGSAQVVEIGTTTDIGGCTPGLVTSYGSTSDAGNTTRYLDMDDRPATDDLSRGGMLAGMSDTDPAGLSDPTQYVARTVTFKHAAVTFANTGTSVPRDIVDGWFVLDFGTFQRGYTRIAVDTRTHAETWMGAAWSSGRPASVFQTMMVVPNAAAGFGGHDAQSHVWEEGLFAQSPTLVYFPLYPDYTGLFETTDTSGNIQQTMPATWLANGSNLVISRSNDPTSYERVRTWVPIANYGKAHFVFENEDFHDLVGGTVTPGILPRVNFYSDDGKATPSGITPTARPQARQAAKAAARGLPQ